MAKAGDDCHPVVARKLAEIGGATDKIVEGEGYRLERSGDVWTTAWIRLSARTAFGASADGAWVVVTGATLPDALASALGGRGVEQVVDHPLLEGMRIERVEQRANGFRLILAD